MEGAGAGEAGFRPESFSGPEVDELGDTEVKVTEVFIDQRALRLEVGNEIEEQVD